MATTHEPEADVDVIDLEPTLAPEAMHPGGRAAQPFAPPGAEASLVRETATLRRRRIAGAAAVFALMYGLLFLWNVQTWAAELRHLWVLMAARFALAAVVAALLMSPIRLGAAWVRALELVLFGGLTLLMIVGMQAFSSEVIRLDDLPAMVALLKNAVIQTVILLMVYGMLIPNPPRVLAWGVLLMALAPMLGLTILFERSEMALLVQQYRSVQQSGSNNLFLLIAAGIAVLGGLMVNGMREELHEARKYGQYHLIRKLGAGGMGEVFLAEHQLLKRPCALKLIRTDSHDDPLAVARFEREVQSAARLQHPNAIEIFDYGQTEDGTFYYVMEYLNGLSLAELVERHGPLPAGRVIYLFRQACAALAEVHRLGLVHRDLKPANLFVAVRGGEFDVAKVLDFGLVKVHDDGGQPELTRENTVSGTPHYMAPEQAAAAPDLDGRADIYALGAMMYHALSGAPPFGGTSPIEVMISHARDAVPSLASQGVSVPDDLEAVVRRCLAKQPGERYATVRAVGEALAACGSASEWGPNRAEAWWEAQGGV